MSDETTTQRSATAHERRRPRLLSAQARRAGDLYNSPEGPFRIIEDRLRR